VRRRFATLPTLPTLPPHGSAAALTPVTRAAPAPPGRLPDTRGPRIHQAVRTPFWGVSMRPAASCTLARAAEGGARVVASAWLASAVLLTPLATQAQPATPKTDLPAAPVEPKEAEPAPAPEPESAPEAATPGAPVSATASAATDVPGAPRPPPLNVEYAQYGVAIAAEFNVDPGAACPDDSTTPCIIGSGGGLVIRGGYRSPGPWYIGGAYEFIKMDSGNLYRLGIFQQLRAEMRYLPEIGAYRVAPYFAWGLGGVAYGNEWGVQTGGAVVFGGAGIEFEVSRVAMVGLNFVYRPVLIAGWVDTAGQERETAFAQFIGIDLTLELRTELGRR
jgi:hypothetical protein